MLQGLMHFAGTQNWQASHWAAESLFITGVYIADFTGGKCYYIIFRNTH